MDLFGAVDPPSIIGKKYTLVVVDNYTRYTWAIFMNKKCEALKKLHDLTRLVQNEKGCIMIKNLPNCASKFLNKVIRE